jgi:O-antigen/teichoic acid export membrane protein
MTYSLRSVIQGSTVYTAGSFLVRATGFLLVPIYTRYLTPHDYGIIGILNVVVTLMSSVLALGLYQAQTRFYHEVRGDREQVGELLFSTNAVMVGVTLAICGTLTVVGAPVFERLLRNDSITFVPFVVIVLWTVFFTVLNRLMLNYYVAKTQYTYSAALQFVQFVTTVGFIILFVVVRGEGALGSVKGVFAGNVTFFVLFYWRYAAEFVRRLNARYIVEMVKMGLPIMIHMTAGAAMVSVDRLVLERYLSLSEVGLYTLGFSFASVLSVIVMSINRAWMPNYYQLMGEADPHRSGEIRRAYCLWVTAIGTVCIAASVGSRELVELFTTQRFFAAARVVPVILLGFFFQGTYFFMVAPIFHFKRTALLPIITLTAAAVNIALNLLLIPRFGIMGAAAATATSFVALAAMAYVLGRRLHNPRFETARFLTLIAAVSAVSIAAPSNPPPLLEVSVVPAYLILCYLLFPAYLRPVAASAISYVKRRS